MNAEATIVLVAALAFLVGCVVGGYLRRPLESAPPAEPVPRPRCEGLAVVRAELLEDATAIARTLLQGPETDADDADVARLADEIAAFGAARWSEGLGDARDALHDGTGLEPELADAIGEQMLRTVEARRGLVRS